MECPRCHQENRTEARFCEDCGAPLAVKCPSCGAALTAGKKFCGACGHTYRSNGSDNFQRKCPRCQGGAPGLGVD